MTTEQTKNETSTLESKGWSGAQFQFYQAGEMKDWILLDNGSTVNLFCNPNLVENIRTSNETLELSTNGGDFFTNKCATVPGFGEVWYDPNAMTNIFSLALLEKKYRVTYDSTAQPAFIVHLPDKQVRFERTESGLYIFKPKYNTKSTINKNCSFLNHSVESIEENKKILHRQTISTCKTRTRNISCTWNAVITRFQDDYYFESNSKYSDYNRRHKYS